MSTIKTTLINVKVNNVNGRLTSISPITLKNQIKETRKLADLKDVSVVDLSAGATLVYNETNQLYEVEQINLDGGTY
jgi:hypothetical protein